MGSQWQGQVDSSWLPGKHGVITSDFCYTELLNCPLISLVFMNLLFVLKLKSLGSFHYSIKLIHFFFSLAFLSSLYTMLKLFKYSQERGLKFLVTLIFCHTLMTYDILCHTVFLAVRNRNKLYLTDTAKSMHLMHIE